MITGVRKSRGFALPTILIASIVMLSVLLVSVSSTTAIRTVILNQYYSQLAQVAGEAGVSYAEACLANSDNIPQWSDAYPLTPGTDCSGLFPSTVTANVLAVAGGGSGSSSTWGGGGGGGGGVIYDQSMAVSTGATTVTVGLGGAATSGGGNTGGDSLFGSLKAFGGGGGMSGTGGNGGGDGHSGLTGRYGVSNQTNNNGGTGYGNRGGYSTYSSAVRYPTGGGGGSGGPGGDGITSPGVGGPGIAFDISGTLKYYAGGGGASDIDSKKSAGGIGGGGGGDGNVIYTNATETTRSPSEYAMVPILSTAQANLGKTATFYADLKSAINGNVAFYALGKYEVGFYSNWASTTAYQRIKSVGAFSYNSSGANGEVSNLSFYGGYGSGVIPTFKNVKIELDDVNGTDGLGGGGGGGTGDASGKGGSGVVIVSYPTGALTATGGTITTSGGNTIHKFTSSGTFSVTGSNITPTCPGSDSCYVSVDGNVRSSFKVGMPSLDASGEATTIPNTGYVEVTRTSTGSVWRTYSQPLTQPAVVPNLCFGGATSALGWSDAVVDNNTTYSFPESTAKYIAIGSTSPNPGPMYFRRDFSVTQAGTYVLNNMGDDHSNAYIDGQLVSSVAWNSVDTQTVNLDVGCHTVVAKVINTGILPNPSRLRFSLKLTGNSAPLLVTDTSWRVTAGSQVAFSTVNYYQSSAWTAARDLGTVVPTAKVLVVAGGGGGSLDRAGAGGGGGLIYNSTRVLTSKSYSVVVGAGGAGGAQNVQGSNGGNSSFDSLTAVGGGGGGTGSGTQGSAGGSGGGGGNTSSCTPCSGGSATSGQGNNGGSGVYTSPNYGAGGGGGAGGVGSNGTSTSSGNGGVGLAYTITGASVYYAGGGGAGSYNNGTNGTGGLGGGGNGGPYSATSGSANTGGGGGSVGTGTGSTQSTGGNGGSGVVIVSYPISPIKATGGTVTTSGGTIHTFTSSGTFTNTWVSTSGNSTARWISTTHSYDGSGNYPSNSYAMFRDSRTVTVTTPTEVKLSYYCDDSCNIYVDGNQIAHTDASPLSTTTMTLTEGTHKFGVTLGNGGGPSAFAFAAVRTSDNVTLSESDATWKATNAWYTTLENPTSFDNSFGPTPVLEQEIIPNGLIAIFNPRVGADSTNWVDTSANKHDIALTDATYDNSTIKSINFNGTSTYGTVYGDRPIVLSRLGATADFWVKKNSTANLGLFTYASGSYKNHVEIRNNMIFGEARDNCNSMDSPSFTFNTGQWYNISFVFKDSRVYWYVNGVSIGETPSYGILCATGSPVSSLVGDLDILYIGQATAYGTKLDGNLGDMMFYSRSLTDSEILHNYNATKGYYGL